jgi:SAM-dependent methyltransferase
MTRALRCGADTSWTCVEPDAELAAVLQQAVQGGSCGAPETVRVVVGSVADLAPDAQFDTILYIDVLEHIADDRREMARAAERLAPNGRLIVLSPAHRVLYSAFDQAVGHFRRYSRQSLRNAGPAELSLVRIRYLDCVGFLASLANRFVLHSRSPAWSLVKVWDTMMVPLSRLFDPLLLFCFGKSVLAVWEDSGTLRADRRRA